MFPYLNVFSTLMHWTQVVSMLKCIFEAMYIYVGSLTLLLSGSLTIVHQIVIELEIVLWKHMHSLIKRHINQPNTYWTLEDVLKWRLAYIRPCGWKKWDRYVHWNINGETLYMDYTTANYIYKICNCTWSQLSGPILQIPIPYNFFFFSFFIDFFFLRNFLLILII